MTFYKVTKPDGSPFHGSGIVYEAGKTYRRSKTGKVELCSASALHASRMPEQAARYGTWPYRLWEVEGRVRAEQEDKCGFAKLTVVRELPVHLSFGPNGEAVLRVIERAATLTSDEAQALDAARYAARYAAWDAAWYAAWPAARYAARYAAWDAARYAAADAARYAAADAARYAAADAALATCVQDLVGQHGLTQEHIDTLRKPWLDAIGPTWEAAS